ncbi:MAG: hypothetical protein M0R17_05745 [Candidatus Omnitrophica bacterium]|jgi:hypothetical protein|nr:hypothetical protein [Candidatus Omnitrophota bacterium]
MNKIILKAEGELIDKECRDLLNKLWAKVETLNDRTKAHTIQIKELEKRK